MTSARSATYRDWGKRLFDLVAATAALLLLAPLCAVVGLMVRLFIGSPVLFRQERPGRHARPFRLVKFRTMTNRTDESGRLLTDRQRITALGGILRSSSLDELPELFNVLQGSMSLVGPRPLLMQYVDRYSPEQARRHEVCPGITGLAQVNGRNAISWERKFELDVHYVDHCSFALDARILGRTVWQVLARTGISEPGHATATEFTGSQGR